MRRLIPLRRLAALLLAAWLSACGAANFDRPGAAGDEASYAALHPFYAEFCALSQIKKQRGFGADIRGEIGGHAVFYLNGACRDPASLYPVLQVCAPAAGPPSGVGLSMNAHFRNAKWVAVPGRDFFFRGNLPQGGGLTRAGYAQVQAEAKRLRLYDGIAFWPEATAGVPAGFAPDDAKYEVSIATDYATGLGRGRFCARVPVTRPQMARMVAFLNEQNAPYRRGEQDFHWSVFRDNCIHLAHNALAEAGVWDEWRINRFILWAVLSFPVPKNEFVNLMRRTNDLPLLDLAALYRDAAVRRELQEYGRLPTGPGALAEASPPLRPNAVYDTDLKLIFYDEPVFGPYNGWFEGIFADPRYFDTRRNLEHFTALYRQVEADRRPLSWWASQGTATASAAFAAFYGQFYAAIARERLAAEQQLAGLSAPVRPATGS